jgi:hypothetical protein
VRRPPKGNAAFVHDLLLFLEDQDFPFAPRFLGMDEQGQEILSYLEGEIWPESGSSLPDDLLEQAARAIRSFHDTTAGSRLLQAHEIVAHHDTLTTHYSFSGWTRALASLTGTMQPPAHGCVSLPNAVYNFVDVSHWANQEASEQARRIHLMCAAYGWDDPTALVNDARGRSPAGVTQS